MLGTPWIHFFFPNEITMKNNLAILENNGSDTKDAQNLLYPINAASTTQEKGPQPVNLFSSKRAHLDLLLFPGQYYSFLITHTYRSIYSN